MPPGLPGWCRFCSQCDWDLQHRRSYSPLPSDIDIIWFDEALLDPEVDNLIEINLCRLATALNWSVKNQARMHVRNDDQPYSSATNAMKAWPETATSRRGQAWERRCH
ncbi:nucleotidyltransferase family protein [Pseudomonas amygdali]|uniref:nucleotidyltransferase family protein n=1 Tax=Pseudomonas amygdali TaxID=47877 RepID=UPI0021E566C4|nr:nucleotidyltransferase family protein [Pseudomonas amygdali]